MSAGAVKAWRRCKMREKQMNEQDGPIEFHVIPHTGSNSATTFDLSRIHFCDEQCIGYSQLVKLSQSRALAARRAYNMEHEPGRQVTTFASYIHYRLDSVNVIDNKQNLDAP
jgi:hypothetical protein